MRKRAIMGVALVLIFLLGTVLYKQPVNRKAQQEKANSIKAMQSGQPVLEASIQLQAQSAMFQGKYQQVESLLTGKFLGPEAAIMLIRAELAQGEGEKALSTINNFRFIPQVAGMQALYLASRGEYQNAYNYLVEYKKSETTPNMVLQLCLSQLLIKLDRPDEASQVLQSMNSSLPGVVLVKGDLALAQGDYSLAWELYAQDMEKGYLAEDQSFLARGALAAVGAGKDWTSLVDRIRQQDPQSGMADYCEALAVLQAGDLTSAQSSLRSALNHNLPTGMYSQISALQDEITARISAEKAIQTVINQGGH